MENDIIVKLAAAIVTLVTQYYLYRIICPKQKDLQKSDKAPEKDKETVPSVMGKSRYVLPERSKPLQAPATSTEFENIEKKPYILVPENENRNAVIPTEKLDEVFAEEINTDELEIEPDENEKDGTKDEKVDFDDEATEFKQETEQLASGMSIEEMTEAAKAIDNPTDEQAGILFKVEKTDMFEQMVSGDEGKAERIKSIIDRYVQSIFSETENQSQISDTDYGNFDVAGFLGS